MDLNEKRDVSGDNDDYTRTSDIEPVTYYLDGATSIGSDSTRYSTQSHSEINILGSSTIIRTSRGWFACNV